MNLSAGKSGNLKEVAALFFKLGAISFGGPAAYIAIMHRETVRRRGWLDNQKFLDLVGAVNLIPGPNATELANYLGQQRAGWSGLISAGVLFILPGMLLTLVLAWAYVNYGALPQTDWILYGIKPVVIAIVVQALWGLGRSGIKGPLTAALGIAILLLYQLGINEIALLFGGAAVFLAIRGGHHMLRRGSSGALLILPLLKTLPIAAIGATAPFSPAALFLTFLKIGAILYGSGYVLFAFMNSEFVQNLGWLSQQQLLDAIAAGQVTPGPVFTSATFAGYLMGGWPSALLATLAIFLPSFVLVGALSRVLPWLQKTAWARAFLDGVNVAALGLMAGVTWQLGRAGIQDIFTLALMVTALLLAFRFKINSAWLLLGGGLAGIIYRMILI
ncbi:MAG: chromate efflux transporter [Chloroflexi bacterium]|nr:chromate efflux transporter [Chloroflexota bacterium]